METVKKILPLDQMKLLVLMGLCILLYIHAIIILAGGLSMSSGSLELNASKSVLENASVSFLTSIAGGLIFFAIATIGLVAVLLRHRILLIIVTSLALLFLSLSLGMLIDSAYRLFSIDMEALDVVVEELVWQYGKKGDSSLDVTHIVDKFQENSQCCGWSDSDNSNFFLSTPWYLRINATTPEGQPRKTLPGSCCVSGSDSCIITKTLREARQEGLIHKKDCLRLLFDRIKTVQLVRFFCNTASLIILCSFLVISMMHLIEVKKQ